LWHQASQIAKPRSQQRPFFDQISLKPFKIGLNLFGWLGMPAVRWLKNGSPRGIGSFDDSYNLTRHRIAPRFFKRDRRAIDSSSPVNYFGSIARLA
jgi:hypothetical protein